MSLWLVFALMTAAAVFAVLWPLSRRAAAVPSGNDVAVYRDQLDEIDRDRAAGLILATEAAAARVEVSRRLLAAAEAAAPSPQSDQAMTRRRRAVAIAALVLLPAGASALYLALGAPSLPAQVAARVDDRQSVAQLVAKVEAHLAQNPDEGRGWEVLAPIYLRMGRFDDAVKARQRAIELLGPTAERQAALGEALTAAANGIVTADALAAFKSALSLDPAHVQARFFVGLAAEQDGRVNEAIAAWRALLETAPPDAPWAEFVRGELLRAAGGPGTADVAAAAKLSNDERRAMIRGMVARLAERLDQDGSNVDGWLQLVRSYMVLGERERALAAASAARRALAADPQKLRRIDELVRGLGLEG